jgi:hypothetical protein
MRIGWGGALLAFFVVLGGAARAAPGLDDAVAAYLQLDFAAARSRFEAIANNPTASPADREEALRRLALLDWRIAGDFSAAERRLAQVAAIGAKPIKNSLALAREKRSARLFDEARAAALDARTSASTQEEQEAADLELAQVTLDRLHDVPLADYVDGDHQELRSTLEALKPWLAAPPTSESLAITAFALAVRAGDGASALAAWRAFVRRDSSQMSTTSLAAPDLVFVALLPTYQGERAGALALVSALIQARFFKEAVLLADAASLLTPEIADARVYERFRCAIGNETDRFYQATARNHAKALRWHEQIGSWARGAWDAFMWQQRIESLARTAWGSFTWQGPAPPFSMKAFNAEIEKRFGAILNIGETSGYDDLHMGHIFIDRTQAISQYGRHASLRFIALDWMVSNGYESWVWDGAQAHGGWATADVIYQVRPSYSEGPLRLWRRLNDPQARAEKEAEIAEAEAGDDSRAKIDPAGYLPGLSERLRWLGAQELHSAVESRVGFGPALKLQFIAAYEEAILQTSIFIHEGRHVLDKREYSGAHELSSEELEYRAKLSELALSPIPRLVVGPIFNPTLDGATPHGRAAHRVVAGILAWVKDHAGAIKGLDLARPIQPQLVLLTNGQWHRAAAAQDPWATAGP